MFVPRIKPTSLKRLKQLDQSRTSERYKEWKQTVFERDDHKCQYPKCDSILEIQAHHIMKFAKATHLRYNPSNGITLCKRCHAKVTGREQDYVLMFVEIVKQNEERKKESSDNL